MILVNNIFMPDLNSDKNILNQLILDVQLGQDWRPIKTIEYLFSKHIIDAQKNSQMFFS